MKINREQLKALIKECIVEVLSEGLGPQLAESSNRRAAQVLHSGPTATQPRRQPPSQSQRLAYDPALDTPVGKKPQPQQSQALDAAIKASSKGNSTMAAIFADTARTTMMEQASYKDPQAGGGVSSPSSVEQINGRPEEIFGEETAAQWAALAFAPQRDHSPMTAAWANAVFGADGKKTM